MPVSSMKSSRAAPRMTLRRTKHSRSSLDLRAVLHSRGDSFLRDMPISMSRRDTVEMLARTFIRFAISTTNSSNVASAARHQEPELLLLVLAQKPLLARRRPRNQMPSASRRRRILRTQLSLTPRRSATSRLVAPSSSRATARSRKSNEYGWNMNDAINTSTRRQKALL